MARLIRHDATGPRRLDADDLHDVKGDIAVCQCGLSAEYPFCDGSHRATEREQPDTLYRYSDDDDDGERFIVEQVVLNDGGSRTETTD
ncbi:MAG: CDGSH iron-sulfur domain-containing protein [Halobacteriales archaeon]|nr:CDGSH iron-sulfur domain-containing protein [Halobacteriales archaeon]